MLLDEGLVFSPEQSAELLAVDEALERLAKLICKRPTFSMSRAPISNGKRQPRPPAPMLWGRSARLDPASKVTRKADSLLADQSDLRSSSLRLTSLEKPKAHREHERNWRDKGVDPLHSCDSNDSIDSMATLTIRQLDEKTKTRLRVRAAHHGRSMEEEAREILRSALTASSPGKGNLAEAIRRRFAVFGGLEFELPQRDAMRHAPNFPE